MSTFQGPDASPRKTSRLPKIEGACWVPEIAGRHSFQSSALTTRVYPVARS